MLAVPDEYAHLPAPATPAGGGSGWNRVRTRASTTRACKSDLRERKSRSIILNRAASAFEFWTIWRLSHSSHTSLRRTLFVGCGFRRRSEIDVIPNGSDTSFVSRASCATLVGLVTKERISVFKTDDQTDSIEQTLRMPST
jgi:hypothetical protein